MNYLPLIKKLAPYLIIAVLAAAGMYKVQQLRIDMIKTELTVCHDANAASVKTIGQMQADAAKNNVICEKTLRSTERTIQELKRIDSLGSTLEGGNHAPTDSDPLLAELNGMFQHAAR